jgi:hypothetical protein
MKHKYVCGKRLRVTMQTRRTHKAYFHNAQTFSRTYPVLFISFRLSNSSPKPFCRRFYGFSELQRNSAIKPTPLRVLIPEEKIFRVLRLFATTFTHGFHFEYSLSTSGSWNLCLLLEPGTLSLMLMIFKHIGYFNLICQYVNNYIPTLRKCLKI